MTAVGWVGLGKLGGPCAAALAYYGGHIVYGYDVRGTNSVAYDWGHLPPVGLVTSIERVVVETDEVVFVAVQTPHSREYGGEVPVPSEPRDFEYAYLVNAVRDVCATARKLQKHITLAVVSTVLPGTFDRALRPLLNDFVTPVYHPFFIAMGTVVDDFISPELTLFGVDRPGDERPVADLYHPIHDAPAPTVLIPSAELAKVAYNTFITSKIVFANALAELSEATGADVDEVTGVLAGADQRVISARYLRAGMGDGGACHPRDLMALSALAQRVDASVDLMGFLARARDAQVRRLADVVEHWVKLTDLPLVLLGAAYKPEVALVDGSPTRLLEHDLVDRRLNFITLDPVVDPGGWSRLAYKLEIPSVFVVTTAHQALLDLKLPAGSVVIDPFGRLTPQTSVTMVTPGRRGARRS